MEQSELLVRARKLFARMAATQTSVGGFSGAAAGVHSEVSEFLRVYSGAQSSFYKNALNVRGGADFQIMNGLKAIMISFIAYVESGLSVGISPERQAQLDVVSDFLEQASNLLGQKGVHPAAPAVLIGATLEEYLRTWIESIPLPMGSRKPSLQAYSQILKEAEVISKQDVKDIISWSGIRNHAAHGEWDEVDDKQRVILMLEGVNLFMRRYGA